MPVEGLGWTFDAVAEDYDRYRPGYPEELYRDLFAYCAAEPGERALEIGMGTGQATGPVLAAGWSVTGVEMGAHLAQIAARKFAGMPLTVLNTAFEACELPENSFGLAYSASAFHWVPEETGYMKVLRLLKPGGVFARFASHPYYFLPGQEALWEDIQRCYRRYRPGERPPDPHARYDEAAAARRSAIAAKYGFTDITTRIYHRDLRYSGAEYARRLSIESDKIAMEARARELLLAEIAQTVERHGGTIVVRDMIDMNLARKPG